MIHCEDKTGALTKFGDLRELASLGIIQDLAVIPFACNVDAEYYRLVDHLIEMNCGADVLGYLGLGINEKIARDVHQLDQKRQVVFDSSVVQYYEPCAFLRTDAFVRIIQT